MEIEPPKPSVDGLNKVLRKFKLKDMYINQFELGIKKVLFAIFISFSLSLQASNYNQEMSYLNHLSQVNKEWLHHKDACPKATISFRSDIDRIQLHLNLVIEYLKSNSPSNLNSTQLSNRFFLLTELQKYADNKVFPVNNHHLTRQPYFVDDFGTNCAVGQMIYSSGYKHLVDKIHEENNYDYIADIKTKGIEEWAIKFGFTIEELKWIQPGYAPTVAIEQVLGGTNGSVKKIKYNVYNGSLTIAGSFTELNNLPCLNVGVYMNNQLSCLGAGVDGIINNVLNLSGDIYVLGELHHNGQIFPAAKYSGGIWTYITIPNRDGATSTSANYGAQGYQMEMAISHSSIPEHQEVWYLLNDNTWVKKIKVKGVILDMQLMSNGRVRVGHFDSVTVYNSNATIDTVFETNNVIFNTFYPTQWFGLDSDISDTVNVVKNIGNALILGGTCSNQPSASNVCISRYYNSVLQPLLLNYNSINSLANYSVNTIAYNNGSEFTFGGKFVIQDFGGVYGNNLATYSLVSNSVNPIALFDQPVNSIEYYNNDLYIGGDFQTNLGNQNINYLGHIVSNVGIDKPDTLISLNVFPIPFISSLNLKGIENGVVFSILNVDGRIFKSGTVMNEKITDLDFLPKGAYFLKLETSEGAVVKKIFK